MSCVNIVLDLFFQQWGVDYTNTETETELLDSLVQSFGSYHGGWEQRNSTASQRLNPKFYRTNTSIQRHMQRQLQTSIVCNNCSRFSVFSCTSSCPSSAASTSTATFCPTSHRRETRSLAGTPNFLLALSYADRQIASCKSHLRILGFLRHMDTQILSFTTQVRFLSLTDQIASCSSKTRGTSSPKTHQAR